MKITGRAFFLAPKSKSIPENTRPNKTPSVIIQSQSLPLVMSLTNSMSTTTTAMTTTAPRMPA